MNPLIRVHFECCSRSFKLQGSQHIIIISQFFILLFSSHLHNYRWRASVGASTRSCMSSQWMVCDEFKIPQISPHYYLQKYFSLIRLIITQIWMVVWESLNWKLSFATKVLFGSIKRDFFFPFRMQPNTWI